jgi:hypothetical protein
MARPKSDNTPLYFVQDDSTVFVVRPNDVKRNWFLTINENAECFNRVVDTCQFFNINSEDVYNWACIYHDKDTMKKASFEKLPPEKKEEYVLVEEENRTVDKWAYKKPHWHVVLSFGSAKTFNRIRKSTNTKVGFDGANVEPCISLGSAFAYLTHNTDRCIKEGKHVYSQDEIITNNRPFFTTQTVTTVVFESFDPTLIPKYVFVDGCDDYLHFALRFGCPQVQRWMGSINAFSQLKATLLDKCHGSKYCTFDEQGLHFLSDIEVNMLNRTESIFCEIGEVRFTELGKIIMENVLRYNDKDSLSALSPMDIYLCNRYLSSLVSLRGDDFPHFDLSIFEKTDLVSELSREFDGKEIVNN